MEVKSSNRALPDMLGTCLLPMQTGPFKKRSGRAEEEEKKRRAGVTPAPNVLNREFTALAPNTRCGFSGATGGKLLSLTLKTINQGVINDNAPLSYPNLTTLGPFFDVWSRLLSIRGGKHP